ncbi:hypothetical protein [Nitrosophilus labii]|uniref:hypothetical protein n=1 Tax=Nitrosophilus labii TaxID=2706014 RepID=UPI001656F632|nr:hypothetical protein [Nitrosophilus labii]
MFNISREFAPPFKLIVPFFIVGTIFYILSAAALLFISFDYDYMQMSIAGWVHLFLLGYVMMIIFGAMAQLIPVVLETGHFSVDFYYVIFPLLLFGTIIMVMGFWSNPILLSFGGILVLAAMGIFAIEVFLTIKKTDLNTLTVKCVKVSNIFLLLGILSGFLLSLTISGFLGVDINSILKAHVYAVVGGYIMITIMGITLILLPMFGLAHGFDERPVNLAFKIMSYSVALVMLGAFLDFTVLTNLGYIGAFASVMFYFYQIFLIYKTRVRKESDIWYKSIFFSYLSLLFSWILGFVYLLSTDYRPLLYGAVWFLFMGFFSFLINGHLYKIVPFLVWFHRYAPLVGKEKVPMLHEMYPKKQAEYEFWFTMGGTLIAGFGLIIESADFFKAGVAFLFIGSIFLGTSLKWMLNFGRN